MRNDKEKMKNKSLSNGSLLLNGKYKIISYLSIGGSSLVYIGENWRSEKVVIKELFVQGEHERNVKNNSLILKNSNSEIVKKRAESFFIESQRIASMESDYFVKLIDFFKENNTFYMVQSFKHGLSLEDSIRMNQRFSEYEILKIIYQGLKSIQILKEMDWVHCDIKPSNLYLDTNGDLLILDLGSTYQFKRHSFLEATHDTRKNVAITTPFAPEEMIKGGISKYIGWWSDLFSLGISIKLITSSLKISKTLHEFISYLCEEKVQKRMKYDLNHLILKCEEMMKFSSKTLLSKEKK